MLLYGYTVAIYNLWQGKQFRKSSCDIYDNGNSSTNTGTLYCTTAHTQLPTKLEKKQLSRTARINFQVQKGGIDQGISVVSCVDNPCSGLKSLHQTDKSTIIASHMYGTKLSHK